MTNQRGSLVLYLAAIVLIVVVSGAAFFMWQRTQNQPATQNQIAETVETVQTSPTAMPSSASDSAEVNVEDEFKTIDIDLEAL